ncbi:MAG: YidB family protein [Rugosibacter sp.]|nr:YidB family protein [Rugosibacter sp.]
MGLFDQIVGAVSGQQGESGGSLLGSVLQMVTNPQNGGLSGLLQTLQQGGLAEAAKSWVSTGQNLPVSAEQIQSALGNDTVKNLAAQLGLNTEQMSGHLAELLPQVVDKLTPNGSVPSEGNLVSMGMELLKGKLLG